MKRILLLPAFMLCLCVLSCVEDVRDDLESGTEVNKVIVKGPDPVEFEPVSGSEATRGTSVQDDNALLFGWTAGDTLGIFPDKGNQVEFPISAAQGTTIASFDGGGWALKNNSSYAAYYPFSVWNYHRNNETILLDYSGQIQDGKGSFAHLSAYDFLASEKTAPQNGSIVFQMDRQGSILYIDIAVPEPGTLKTFELTCDEAIFVEKAYLDISGDTPVVIPLEMTESLTLSFENIVTTTPGENVRAYLAVQPVDFRDKTVIATIVTDKDSYAVPVISRAVNKGKAAFLRFHEKYSVQGKVVYDDGKPAAGIKVSDGFTVVETDETGNYEFKTAGMDVRYIYISLPADARISKNVAGCPDFYQKYETDRYIYDFTLVRQPVEREFAFFAFADPQTHYLKRDTQTMPDTDRFGNESVPAINSELSKQTLPCYGICLGDITYSEGNRNSTPAMEIIRGHIGRINMPVFNVMGNHDYTFFSNNEQIGTTETSSTINLLAQRNFEDVFGPVNFSFDRGDVHFVCMKNVYYTSTTSWYWSNYQGGFTDEEYNWLVQDLEKTPKNKKIVFCVHIPISTSSGLKFSQVQTLLRQFSDYVIFSGHSHYQRAIYRSGRLYEQVHSALCGQWWWSNIEGDGCPNGYTIHFFRGTDIFDSYFIGVNEGMNTREYQMRIYKGNLLTGGQYARFQMPYSENEYLINVFNGDSQWTVNVYENGVYAGQASLIPQSKVTFNAGSTGMIWYPEYGTSQDWWATAYHIGYCNRGASGSSYYKANYHMWKWTAINPSAKISVEAIDPYGNTYTCDEIITDGENYPDYIKVPLSIF